MRIVVTGGSGKAGRWVVKDLRDHGHYVTNVDTRHDGCRARPVPARRPRGLRADRRGPRRLRRRRPPRRDPRPRHPPARRHVPQQRPVDVQRVRGRRGERPPAGRLGVERDRARPAVRHAAAVRAHRRDHRAAPGVVATPSRSWPARRWRPSSTGGPGSRSSACGSRTSWSPTTTPRFPSYWDDATLRKWNLWGYVDCRDVAQACRLGADRGRDRSRGLHRRRRRHRDDPPERGPDGRGLPRRPADAARSRAARRSCRSTAPAESSATRRTTAGPTTWRRPRAVSAGQRSPPAATTQPTASSTASSVDRPCSTASERQVESAATCPTTARSSSGSRSRRPRSSRRGPPDAAGFARSRPQARGRCRARAARGRPRDPRTSRRPRERDPGAIAKVRVRRPRRRVGPRVEGGVCAIQAVNSSSASVKWR